MYDRLVIYHHYQRLLFYEILYAFYGSCLFRAFYYLYLVVRQVAYQHILKLFRIYGLSEIIRKSDRKILFPRAGNGICRKRYHGRVRTLVIRKLLHPFEAFDTIHNGHAVIQKDHIVFILLHKVESLLSAVGNIYGYLCFFQEVFHNLEIHLCIINDEDPRRLRGKPLVILFVSRGRFLPAVVYISDRLSS